MLCLFASVLAAWFKVPHLAYRHEAKQNMNIDPYFVKPSCTYAYISNDMNTSMHRKVYGRQFLQNILILKTMGCCYCNFSGSIKQFFITKVEFIPDLKSK